MAHTPGPWTVQEVRGSFQVPFHVLAADKKPVAWCEGQQLKPDRTSIGEARANARLIAAAPELLRELKFAVSVLQDNHIARGVAAALAAIRQAEGRTE